MLQLRFEAPLFCTVHRATTEGEGGGSTTKPTAAATTTTTTTASDFDETDNDDDNDIGEDSEFRRCARDGALRDTVRDTGIVYGSC